jgi:ribosomal protein L22
MAEQKTQTKKEDKKMEEKKLVSTSPAITQEVKKDEVKSDVKVNEVESAKKESKPAVKPVISKKDEAVAKGVSLHMSKRHGMYISSFIKGKKIDEAISMLEDVVKMNRAVPFKGEIPHRKGMMSGRYPINASKLFIQLLKGLKGNVVVNGMDLDKTRIFFAHSTFAQRHRKKLGNSKRAHITLKAKEFNAQEIKGKMKPKETEGVLGGGKK